MQGSAPATGGGGGGGLAQLGEALYEGPLLVGQPLGDLHLDEHQLIPPRLWPAEEGDPLLRHHQGGPRLCARRHPQLRRAVHRRHVHRRAEDGVDVGDPAGVEHARPLSPQHRVGDHLDEDIEVPPPAASHAGVALRLDPQPGAGVHPGGDLETHPLRLPLPPVAAAGAALGGGLAGAATGGAGDHLLEDAQRRPHGGDHLALAGAGGAALRLGAGLRPRALAGAAGLVAGDLDLPLHAEHGLPEAEGEAVGLVLPLHGPLPRAASASSRAAHSSHSLKQCLEQIEGAPKVLQNHKETPRIKIIIFTHI